MTTIPADIKSKIELTGESLLQRLRETVQPPGKKGTWLRKLNDKQLAEVYQRLKAKQTSLHICRIAQNEWGVMRSSPIKSLTRAVVALRDKMIGTVERLPTKTQEDKYLQKLLQKRKREVEDLDLQGRYNWLTEVHTERLILSLEQERRLNIPLKQTTMISEELRKTMDGNKDLALKTGALDAKPTEHLVKIQHGFQRLGEMLDKEPGGRRALNDVALKLIEQIEEEGMIWETKRMPDGSYVAIDPKTGEVKRELKLIEEEKEEKDETDPSGLRDREDEETGS